MCRSTPTATLWSPATSGRDEIAHGTVTGPREGLRKPMKIGVIGCGRVGRNTLVAFAEHGHDVFGYDVDPAVSRAIGETLGAQAVAQTIEDLLGCDILFECVPTEPLGPSGECDLSILEAVVMQVGAMEALLDYRCKVFVQRSTCPPGTASIMSRHLKRTLYAVNPSFLAKDSMWHDSTHLTRLVVGGPPLATQLVLDAYRLFDHPDPAVSEDYESAEMLKYIENVTDAVLISLWNEFLGLADRLGMPRAAFLKMANEITTRDRFATTVRAPGGAFGLECLPKDLAALTWLARSVGAPAETMAGAVATNTRLTEEWGPNDIPARALLSSTEGRVTISATGANYLLASSATARRPNPPLGSADGGPMPSLSHSEGYVEDAAR